MSELFEEKTAQAKIFFVGLGATVAKSSLGINAGTVFLLGLRRNKQAQEFTYAITSVLELEGSSGSLGISFGWTEWFYITDEAFETFRLENVLGQGYQAEIHAQGVTVGEGKTDIEIGLIGNQGTYKKIVDVREVGIGGFQIAGTSVRGNIVAGPETINRQRKGMSNLGLW